MIELINQKTHIETYQQTDNTVTFKNKYDSNELIISDNFVDLKEML